MTTTATMHRSLVSLLALLEHELDAVSSTSGPELMADGAQEVTSRMLRVRRRIDVLTARTAVAYENSGDWSFDGARSAQNRLAAMSNDPAGVIRRLLEVGAFLSTHPMYAQVASTGDMSIDHVDALRKAYTAYHRLHDALDSVAQLICEWAVTMNPRDFARTLTDLCHRLDPDAVDELDEKRRRETFLSVATTLEGFVSVSGLLDPETGQLFAAMLDSARRAVPSEDADEPSTGEDSTDRPSVEVDPRTTSRRNVDALRRIMQIAGTVTGSQGMATISGQRPNISVVIELEDLMAPDGQPTAGMAWLTRFGFPVAGLTGRVATSLACDATLTPILVDKQGNLRAMFTDTQAIPPYLRKAILVRDHACRFPGCRDRIDDVHHIVFHSHGGPTVQSNLIGLCAYHHTAIHKGQWSISGHPDQELTFTNTKYPSRYLTSHPPGTQRHRCNRHVQSHVQRVLLM
jgi:hypothetical protein